MRDTSCLYAIHERLSSLSEKERKVADFILASPQDAVHPSIDSLAERIGVSESTLFRFVRKLGYEGYQQFRIALATETVEPEARYYDAPVDSESGESVVTVVFRTAIGALERTMRGLDPKAMEKAADLLTGARCVLFLGLGGSAIVAKDAYHKIMRAGIHCAAPEDFHMQLMAASQAGSGDVALLVSHTGANKDALAIADVLRSRGSAVIALSSYPRTPLSKMADVLLLSAAPSSPYSIEAFSARLAQLAIVDALYVEVMQRRGEEGSRALGDMRSAIAKRRT